MTTATDDKKKFTENHKKFAYFKYLLYLCSRKRNQLWQREEIL